MSAELKPCPFCGGSAELEESYAVVQCVVCEAKIEHYADDDAVKNWNTRAPDAVALANDHWKRQHGALAQIARDLLAVHTYRCAQSEHVSVTEADHVLRAGAEAVLRQCGAWFAEGGK